MGAEPNWKIRPALGWESRCLGAGSGPAVVTPMSGQWHLPAQPRETPLAKGVPKARLGITTLPQPAEAACLGGRAVGRDPLAHTAPKHPPASAGRLTDRKLQKACPHFGLPSTRTWPFVGAPAHAKGPQRWFLAEYWCSSLKPRKPRFSQPPPGHCSPSPAVSLWQPLVLLWRDHHPHQPPW